MSKMTRRDALLCRHLLVDDDASSFIVGTMKGSSKLQLEAPSFQVHLLLCAFASDDLSSEIRVVVCSRIYFLCISGKR